MDNKKLLTTKEVALTLDVSQSTVRRWADSGYLPCYRVGESKYRKFDIDDIEKVKLKIYSKDSSANKEYINKKRVVIKKDIPPLPHPAHYLMHRYWGRKAHNVVSEYIKNFTSEGDIVLDPFMGSGVTNIESSKLNRRSVGIDLNPMSVFIVKSTISNVDIDTFNKYFNSIFNELYDKFHNLYDTKCPECGNTCETEIYVWEEDFIKKVRGKCKEHGLFIKDVDDFDLSRIVQYKELFNELKMTGVLEYPTDPIMQYVKRSGRERIDELFTERALIMLSSLRKQILNIEDENIRNLLFLCFTSMLPNVSRMIPGDVEKCTYKSGWVISKFWTPTVHTERNIFTCFKLRFKTILKGKLELASIDSSLANIYNMDSSNLFNIESNSIDYIFTDPPYGESIAYFALSHFWNCWLDFNVDYSSEMIIDSYRRKDYVDYAFRIKQAFKEMYRVLKPNHYMSFTFHNRDLNIWKAILEGCLDAGFELMGIVLQSQAVSSGTQGINKKNTLTGDFVYNFKKVENNIDKTTYEYMKNAEEFIVNTIKEFLIKKDGATSSELYEYIIPIVAKNHAYCNDDGKVINIESLIKKNFDYIEVIKFDDKGIGEDYKWVVK
ncbi:DNA methyltransferase [Alkaliphilus transvaalensis]|uniref:DNA methyltransferase n=1 Tax=Alkaliphilus transvaalensis TaxID=114628 RepID=UPI0005563761|nr:DNA methyltransferase [Alkaliphilus transvaalensis]